MNKNLLKSVFEFLSNPSAVLFETETEARHI
jgi:hypothetical protein